MQYKIWAEGYRATGESGGAICFGDAQGTDFAHACMCHAFANPEFARYFDANRLTYWGCRLFPTEAEARRSFG